MDDLYDEALRETSDYEEEAEVEVGRPRTPIGPIPKDQPDALSSPEPDRPLWETTMTTTTTTIVTQRRRSTTDSESSRSPSPKRGRRRDSFSSSKNWRHRSRTRSSSRGTYDGFEFQVPVEEAPYFCKPCRRGFYTIRELSEHEIRLHNVLIACVECEKKSTSVAKLAAHILYRHPAKSLICYYCDEKFGDVAEDLSKKTWESYREHVYKEIVKRQMYTHTANKSHNNSSGSGEQAMRGVGKCPHGPPVKCKNFPTCPGAKCIYAHGTCRYDSTCNKQSCPFDHSHRPRTCMTCINDMKTRPTGDPDRTSR